MAAVRGEAEVLVEPETARDGLRVIELERQSHNEGHTVPWSLDGQASRYLAGGCYEVDVWF